MDAVQALELYKRLGERVDEVLFNIITNELHHLRTVIDQKNFSIDLIGEQKIDAQKENKRLREALEEIEDSSACDFDSVRQIARQALEGEQHGPSTD